MVCRIATAQQQQQQQLRGENRRFSGSSGDNTCARESGYQKGRDRIFFDLYGARRECHSAPLQKKIKRSVRLDIPIEVAAVWDAKYPIAPLNPRWSPR